MERKSFAEPPLVSLARIVTYVHIQTHWLGNWKPITGLGQLGHTHPEPGAMTGLP